MQTFTEILIEAMSNAVKKRIEFRKDSSRTMDPAKGKFGKPVAYVTTKFISEGFMLYKPDANDLLWFKSAKESLKNVYRLMTYNGNTSLIKVDLQKGNLYYFDNEAYAETDQIIWKKQPIKFTKFIVEEGNESTFGFKHAIDYAYV